MTQCHFFPSLIGALVALSVALTQPALGQATLRPGASPVAPGDTTKPAFDTTSPRYDGITAGENNANTMVAEVDGRAITLGDVGDAIRGLPVNVAALPFETLFPVVIDQLVRREALVIRAQRLAVDEYPEVRRKVKAAADQALANEFLEREIGPTISEAAMLERYRRDFAGRPGADEVRARVIMVQTEAEAAAVIAEIRAGADFLAVARRISKDVTASVGGDLGFLGREGMNPEISAVAFALPVGQMTAYPVRSGTAWFVVRVDERRVRQTPPYQEVRTLVRQALLREKVVDKIREALSDVTIRIYDVSGRSGAEVRPEAK